MAELGTPLQLEMDQPRSTKPVCVPPLKSISVVFAIGLVCVLLINLLLPIFTSDVVRHSAIAFTTQDIIKPQAESVEYEGVELKNRMRILLASDSKAEMANVLLCVNNVGSLSDPWTLHGLAHFTEHMIFMGSKRYPGENALDAFITKHGAFPNAHTYKAATCYFYDINPQYLEESLDIFAAAFEEPLIEASLIDRELSAIENEFRESSEDDMVRQERVDEVTADTTHDNSKFTNGNVESLRLSAEQHNMSLQQAVKDFINDYYSSNLMSAVIISRQSIGELENMAATAFANLVDKNVVMPKWGSPFKDEHVGIIIKVVPIEDVTFLRLVFPLPDLLQFYESKPEVYLATVIGHEAEGSLFSVLHRRGWALQLEAHSKDETPGISFLELKLKLTKEGMNHADEIVSIFFEYIQMLKRAGPQKWFYDEISSINELMFRYKQKIPQTQFLVPICRHVGLYKWKEVLSGPNVIRKYDPVLITDMLNLISPERMRLTLLSMKFQNQTDQKEYHYKIDYKVERIPEEKLKMWNNPENKTAFHLPPKNIYLPTDFEMAENEEHYSCIPKLVTNRDGFHMWFMQDNSYNVPWMVIHIAIRHPTTTKSVMDLLNLEMLIRAFKDSVLEHFYNANLVGFHFELLQQSSGISLQLEGYHSKIRSILQEYLERFRNFRVDLKRQEFDRLKKAYENELRVAINDRHVSLQKVARFMDPYLLENYFTFEERLDALPNCTAETSQAFAELIRNESTVEAFVYGSAGSSEARNISQTIMSTFKQGNLTFNETPIYRFRRLKRGVTYRQQKVDRLFSTNCLYMVVEIDSNEFTEDLVAALTTLLSRLIREPFFNVIRTTEQLAYMVQSPEKRQRGSYGIIFYIVTTHDVAFVEERLAEFLRVYVRNFLNQLSDNVFEEQRQAAIKAKLLKQQKIDMSAAHYWSEMAEQTYILQRSSREAEAMRSLTKADLIKFYNKYFLEPNTTTAYVLYLTNTSAVSKVQWSRRNYTVDLLDEFYKDHDFHTFETEFSGVRMG